MRRLLLCSFAAAGLLLLPSAAALAEWDFGARGGVYSEESDAFAGIEGLTQMGASQWFFNPNSEFVAVDDGDLVTVNGDFHYDFATNGPTYVWAGGGPALIVRDQDVGGSETDPGLNLLSGVGFNKGGSVTPYLQGKLLVSDENEGVLAFGVRF